MPVRAITFDFWFTLFREANGVPRQQLRAEAFSRATGVPVGEAQRTLDRIAAIFRRYHIENQRTLGPRDAVRMAAEYFKIKVNSETAEALAAAFATAVLPYPPEPIEGALDAVRAAAEYGPVGIVSDTGMSPGRVLRMLLDRHGFTPHVACSVFSDEVGVSKPQRPMFDACAGKLQTPLHQILHIGDTEATDISGAHAAGAKAALFTGANPVDRDRTAAEFVFATWSGFIGALPGIMSSASSSGSAPG